MHSFRRPARLTAPCDCARPTPKTVLADRPRYVSGPPGVLLENTCRDRPCRAVPRQAYSVAGALGEFSPGQPMMATLLATATLVWPNPATAKAFWCTLM